MFSGLTDIIKLGLGLVRSFDDEHNPDDTSEPSGWPSAPATSAHVVRGDVPRRPMTTPEKARKRRALTVLFRVAGQRLARDKLRALTEWRCALHVAPRRGLFEDYIAAATPDADDPTGDAFPAAPPVTQHLSFASPPPIPAGRGFGTITWASPAPRRSASARRPAEQRGGGGDGFGIRAFQVGAAGLATIKGNLSKVLEFLQTPLRPFDDDASAEAPDDEGRTPHRPRTLAGPSGSATPRGDEEREAFRRAHYLRGGGAAVRAVSSPPGASGVPRGGGSLAAAAAAYSSSQQRRRQQQQQRAGGSSTRLPPPGQEAAAAAELALSPPATPASRLHGLVSLRGDGSVCAGGIVGAEVTSGVQASHSLLDEAVAESPVPSSAALARPSRLIIPPLPAPVVAPSAVPSFATSTATAPSSAGGCSDTASYKTAADEEEEEEGEREDVGGAKAAPLTLPAHHPEAAVDAARAVSVASAVGAVIGSLPHPPPVSAALSAPSMESTPVALFAPAAVSAPAVAAPAAAVDPALLPYIKMLKAGVPEQAIRARSE